MLTKSEKLVWASAFAAQLREGGPNNVRDAVMAAFEAVQALRLAIVPAGERDWAPAKMLASMREEKL
jgi:hypothetical protein